MNKLVTVNDWKEWLLSASAEVVDGLFDALEDLGYLDGLDSDEEDEQDESQSGSDEESINPTQRT